MHNKRSITLGILSTLMVSACSTPLLNQGPASPFRAQQFRAQNSAKSVVQFSWKNNNDFYNIATSGMDVFGIKAPQKKAKARVSPSEFNQLKAQGFQPVKVLEPGMQLTRNNRGGLPRGYMTYTQLTQKLKAYANQYPDLVTVEDIGDTYDKQQGKSPSHDIWALSITNKKSLQRSKPVSLFTSGVHARELAPVELTMKMADHLLTKYGKDPAITNMLNTREVVILPMVNVDGRVEVEKGDSWKRKNNNGHGVDINRNFDDHWNYEGLDVPNSWKRGLTNPRSQTYSGKKAASEPETQAVQSMYKRKKIALNMDIHAYGEMFFWPVGYSRDPVPEAPTYRKIWQDSFKKIGYVGGTSLSLLYATSGTTDDYGYGQGALSLGLEVGNSFRPSYSQVESMWEETRPHFLHLIKASGSSREINTLRVRRAQYQHKHFH